MTTLMKVSTSTTVNFFMADSTDLTQGKTGLTTFTRRTLQVGGAWGSNSSPTVTETGYGWYKMDLQTTVTGEYIVMMEASGAVTWREKFFVVDALPGNLTDAMIDKIVASIFREPMTTIEASSYGDTITTTNLSLYKAVMAIVGKVALVNGGTTKRIYKTDESSTALDLTLTSGAAPANPIIAQEP